MSKNNKKSFLYLLILPVFFLAVYAYDKDKSYRELEKTLLTEKIALEAELDEIIVDYKDLTVKKKDLSKRLIREMNKIISLKDSLKNLKAPNYTQILKFRKRIITVEIENRDLFAQVDSLSIINDYLKTQKKEVVQQLKVSHSVRDKLKYANKHLTRAKYKTEAKLALAGVLKIDSIRALVMKERRSGKLTATFKANRADAFRVNFRILENQFTNSGEKDIYVRIKDDKNNIIASKGVFKLKDKRTIEYSDKIIAKYRNESMEILSLVFVNRDDISTGNYSIDVFIEGRQVGKSLLKLK